MKLWCVLLALSLLTVAVGGAMTTTCSGTGRHVRQFNGRKEAVKMPCKYHAVRQNCGKYYINLSPGNIYLAPKYRLDTLWLGVLDLDTGDKWEGRTDNKLSVKYYNEWKDTLFVQKDGNINTENLLTFGKNKKETWADAINGDFRVTFTPWDPDNKEFKESSWKFECFADTFEPTGYPVQFCGGESRRDLNLRMTELGLKDRNQVVYHDVFNNSKIAQMNTKCANATRLMTEVCTEEQRQDAILTCSEILSKYYNTLCISKYICNPMDAFVDCIDWVCGGYQDKYACERVGRAIDMCNSFDQGNLTAKVENKNCFKDYLSVVS